jgi:uncharacterized membrane-anchored protein YhcB (DUF1043 family)
MRTFLGKPIRKGVTDLFFEDKMTLEQFREVIVGHFDAYAQNMKNLGVDKEKFIEEWVEQYLGWLDIEQE